MATFSVSDNLRRVQHTGTGGAGPFAFAFQVDAQGDVRVLVDATQKTLTTHYTVSIATGGNGTISFTSGNEPTTAQKITIMGKTPLARTSVYSTGGTLTAASLESDHDTQVMLLQQLQEQVKRSVQLAPETQRVLTGADGTTTGPLMFPYSNTVADNATKLIAFNSAGTALETTVASGITDNSVDSDAYVDGSIDTAHLAADVVTGAKIADDAVDSEHYTDGSIDTAHLAADVITGAKIADDAVDSEHYTDGSIDNAHIADDAIDSEHYADGSIDTAHLAADVITGAKLADDAVDSEHYTDGSIDTAHLAADVITGAKIADDAIDSEHYVDASIDLAHMSANSVDSNQYVDGSIDTAHFAAGSVDATALGADSVTAAKIGDNIINSEHYAAASIDLEHMSVNSVDSDQYVDASIDTAHISDDAVTVAKLANAINTDIATGVAALPKAGGAMTGAITTNSTFDGVDIATRDAVLTSTTTTAGAALSKAGGTMTGNIAMSGSQTVDGRDLSADGTKLDTIESSAKDDQSASEIKTLLEDGIDSVHYVDASIDLAHMSSESVDEDNLHISNSPTNGYMLTAQSSNAGGLTWAAASTTLGNDSVDSQHYVDGSIDTAHYAAGSVDATALGADSVTAAKIGDNVLNSEHYAAASIDLEHMSVNSIDSDQYVDDSIDSAHYAAGSVDATALGADAVTAAKIGDNIINSEHYAAASIDLEHMSSESVDEDNLHISNSPTNGYMLTAQSGNAGGLTWAAASTTLGNDSVDSQHYVAASIDNEHLADDAVDSAELAAGAVDLAHMSDNSVDSAQYVDGSIDNAHIADDAIDSEHYAAGSIDSAHLADDAVTLAKMAGLVRGKIIYGNSSGDPAALTVGSANQILKSDGTDAAWGQASLTASVTGTLPLANGGIGATSLASANIVAKNATSALAVGYSATPDNAGTKSSGTYTPDEADGNLAYAVNGGAHTLAPPTNNCTIIIQYTNNGSAGSITTSGFTQVTGDTITTTNGHDFFMYVVRNNSFMHLHVTALQ